MCIRDSRWAYARNKGLYRQLKAWGQVEHAMKTAWNPVPAVVRFYTENVLFGALDVAPEQRSTADGAESSEQETDALVGAIGRVHEWSNFVMLKQELVKAAAVYGDVLIKVAERTSLPPVPSQGEGERATSVYLQQLPLGSIRYCRADERGIVQEVRIDTPRLTSIFGTAEREHVLVEIWRKSWDGGEGCLLYTSPSPRD